jgi:hypothetical protein
VFHLRGYTFVPKKSTQEIYCHTHQDSGSDYGLYLQRFNEWLNTRALVQKKMTRNESASRTNRACKITGQISPGRPRFVRVITCHRRGRVSSISSEQQALGNPSYRDFQTCSRRGVNPKYRSSKETLNDR